MRARSFAPVHNTERIDLVARDREPFSLWSSPIVRIIGRADCRCLPVSTRVACASLAVTGFMGRPLSSALASLSSCTAISLQLRATSLHGLVALTDTVRLSRDRQAISPFENPGCRTVAVSVSLRTPAKRHFAALGFLPDSRRFRRARQRAGPVSISQSTCQLYVSVGHGVHRSYCPMDIKACGSGT